MTSVSAPCKTSRYEPWLLIASILSVLAILPIMALAISAASGSQSELLDWLASGLLWAYLWRSLVLMLGTALLAGMLGCTLAWLFVFCHFPAKKTLSFLVFLPFAMPAWIMAWSWSELLNYAGPWHNLLKILASWGLPITPNAGVISLSNLWGGVFILGFATYPYVYLICRVSFLRQSASLMDVAQSLKLNSWQFFYRISLPLVRPALAAGMLLVMMEVLNDYGTVRYFSLPVMALAIEDAWINLGNFPLSASLSLLTMLIAFALVAGERFLRKPTYSQDENRRPQQRFQLSVWFSGFVLIPPLIGFIAPFILMFSFAARRLTGQLGWSQLDRLASAIVNSLLLSTGAAVLSALTGLLLLWSVRNSQHRKTRFLLSLATVSYALPAIVLAIGVLMLGANVDRYWHYPLLVGSSFLLIYGWAVRFLSVSIGNLDAGFLRIQSNMVDAAKMLGCREGQILLRVYFPLLKGFFLTAVVMVFIDCMKELAMGLLLRPFNMELLSIYVWQFGSLEQLEEAAPGAIILIFFSLLPLVWLWQKMKTPQ